MDVEWACVVRLHDVHLLDEAFAGSSVCLDVTGANKIPLADRDRCGRDKD